MHFRTAAGSQVRARVFPVYARPDLHQSATARLFASVLDPRWACLDNDKKPAILMRRALYPFPPHVR